MKILLSLLVLSFGFSAYAAKPSDEMQRVLRVLVNNPTIVQQLENKNIDFLDNLEIFSTGQGIAQYKLTFKRNCYCLPATANVSVIEDMTPTYRDGAIAYRDLKIEIKE